MVHIRVWDMLRGQGVAVLHGVGSLGLEVPALALRGSWWVVCYK